MQKRTSELQIASSELEARAIKRRARNAQLVCPLNRRAKNAKLVVCGNYSEGNHFLNINRNQHRLLKIVLNISSSMDAENIRCTVTYN